MPSHPHENMDFQRELGVLGINILLLITVPQVINL